MHVFWQQIVNGVVLGSGYALFALGFGLLFSTLGVLNIAHGMYASFAAIGTWWVMTSHGWSFVPAAVLGVVVGAAIGVLVDVLAFEPLRRRRAGLLGSLITSIGAWILLGNLAENITSFQVKRFPASSFPDQLIRIGFIQVAPMQIVQVGVTLLVGAGMYVLITRTQLGAAIRAVGFSGISAGLSGVNVRRIVLYTVLIAAGVAALAGVLISANTSNVSRGLGDALLFKGFAAVVIGGVGDIRGSLIGGFGLGLTEVLTSQYISSDFRDAITFGLLLAVLVLRPRGLFGQLTTSRA